MVFRFFFISFVLISCDQKVQKGSSVSSSLTDKNEFKTAPLVEEFVLGNEEFVVDPADAEMVQEAARAQGFFTELHEEKGDFGISKSGRMDQFYKCNKNIQHSFIDKSELEDSSDTIILAEVLEKNLKVLS